MSSPRIHHGRFRYSLSDEQVAKMRHDWESTRHLPDDDPNKPTYRTFMDEYSVGNNTVWKVLTYRSYTWVEKVNNEAEKSNSEDDPQDTRSV